MTEAPVVFDTKIAIVLREDLALWQKLNVTAFLTSGLVGASADLMGDIYRDANGNEYNPLIIQPMIVLSADTAGIRKIYRRAMERDVRFSLFIDEMFKTPHDEENRAAVRRCVPERMRVAGLALRESRKVVDKITKGARMHP